MQELPAKARDSLGGRVLLRLIGVLSAAPCCSDQGADLGQHVWGLVKYMADDVGKLSLKIFDRATRYLQNLPAGSGTTCVHVISR